MANGWGGERERAGRPKSANGVRKQHQIRAFDDEWEIIKEFVTIVKKDRVRAERMMQIKTETTQGSLLHKENLI